MSDIKRESDSQDESEDNETNAGTAAREREALYQQRANDAFLTNSNAALDAFDAADEDRESIITEVNFHISNGQVVRDVPERESTVTPSLRALPPKVAGVLSVFPKPWRHWVLLGGIVTILFAMWQAGALGILLRVLLTLFGLPPVP